MTSAIGHLATFTTDVFLFLVYSGGLPGRGVSKERSRPGAFSLWGLHCGWCEQLHVGVAKARGGLLTLGVFGLDHLLGEDVVVPHWLKAIFKRIDEMRQAELEKVAAETMDDYLPYCVVGLSLLGPAYLPQFQAGGKRTEAPVTG